MASVTDTNRPPTALATSSNRLSNRFRGRRGLFPSNASLLSPQSFVRPVAAIAFFFLRFLTLKCGEPTDPIFPP